MAANPVTSPRPRRSARLATSNIAVNSVASPQPRISARFSAALASQLSTIAFTSNHISSNTTAISLFGSAKFEPLKEFAFFPKLPPELRFIIWELSLPKPRVVEILVSELDDSLVARTDSPLPAHFLTSIEAHQVASKNYPLVFSSILSRPIRFSFERDILYFDVEGLFEVFSKEMPDKAKERLCHLMLARDERFLYKSNTIHSVLEFSKLKSITLESTQNAGGCHPDGRLLTMDEKLYYHRQLHAFLKAQTLFSMAELMGNMLWSGDMRAVGTNRREQRRPIFEKLREDANTSRLRSLECK